MDIENNLILIGMPAVGKSTLGILVAKKMGLGFMDTDIMIQIQEGKTLAEIIRESGVDGFLDVEQQYLASVMVEKHVIATGGSAVYSGRGMAHLARSGVVVYLEIGLDHLKRRLSALDERGVIRAPGQDMESLYFERIPLYSRYADFTVRCGTLTPDQILTKIVKLFDGGTGR